MKNIFILEYHFIKNNFHYNFILKMKNEDNNFTKFQQTNECILNSLREESLSNNREITDEYLSSG